MTQRAMLVLVLFTFASCSDDTVDTPVSDMNTPDQSAAPDASVDASVSPDLGVDMPTTTDMQISDASDMALAEDMGQEIGEKCASWSVETIFPIAGHVTTRSGGSSSLVFDAAGAAHVSFTSNLGLYYGTNATGAWAFEQITSPRPVTATALAIDGQGRVDIVYYEGENYDVRQTTNASGDWVTTVIASEGIVGEDLTMAKDSQGRLHIAFLDGTRETLVYGVRESDVWTLEDAETNTPGRPVPSLFMDGLTPLMSFGSYRDGLFFASRATGSWVKETVASGFDLGGWSSLARDVDGAVHISYHKHIVDNGELRYATNESGAWMTETLDATNNSGWDTSLLERGGVIHITYVSSQPSGDLRYAARDASGWTTSSISASSSYSVNSLVFDPDGKLAVSFKRSNNELALARCD